MMQKDFLWLHYSPRTVVAFRRSGKPNPAVLLGINRYLWGEGVDVFNLLESNKAQWLIIGGLAC